MSGTIPLESIECEHITWPLVSGISSRR